MRRTLPKSAVVLGAITLLTLPAISSQAGTGLTSIVHEVADIEEENVIPLGWPSWYEAEECIAIGSCPHLEGQAFAHVNFSEVMKDYDPEEDTAKFVLYNTMLSARTTLWFACSYAGDGTVLDCWYDEHRAWGLSGELSQDARELRLFPIQSAPNEYYLDVWVD